MYFILFFYFLLANTQRASISFKLQNRSRERSGTKEAPRFIYYFEAAHKARMGNESDFSSCAAAKNRFLPVRSPAGVYTTCFFVCLPFFFVSFLFLNKKPSLRSPFVLLYFTRVVGLFSLITRFRDTRHLRRAADFSHRLLRTSRANGQFLRRREEWSQQRGRVRDIEGSLRDCFFID